MTIPILLFIMAGCGVFVLWHNADAVRRKKRETQDANLAQIECVEVHVRLKNGKLERQIVRGIHAKNWFARYVYRRTSIPNDSIKIEKSIMSEVQERRWPGGIG